MKYGYARVSTDEQNPVLQLVALKKAGCRETFTDQGISGTAKKRPALLLCLKILQPGAGQLETRGRKRWLVTV